MYKDAISDLGAVNEHAYWGRVGEPVLNFLPGAPGLVVNVKDAITGGSQMGQATASFLNDGPNADSAGRFPEGFLNAAGPVAGTHWGYKDGVTPSGSYSSVWQNSNIIPDKVAAQAQQDLINELNKFKSNTQAEKVAAMIGAYVPISGKTSVGYSNKKITAESLHPATVNYIEKQLGVKIGEFTSFCKNKAGACAEVSAADSLVRQGVKPENIYFTQAIRPKAFR